MLENYLFITVSASCEKLPSARASSTVMSLPLITYSQIYLIDITEWQNSTNIWALKIFKRMGEQGTTQVLSISKGEAGVFIESLSIICW